MYYIIRIIIVVIAFFKPFRDTAEQGKRSRKYLLGFLAICAIIVLSFIPVENLFVKFDTPEKAYKYVELGKNEPLATIDGNDSSMVVAIKNAELTNLVMPKTGDKWKAGLAIYSPIAGKAYGDNVFVYVYTYKNTDDYYVSVSSPDYGELEFSDEFGTQFTCVTYNSAEFGEGLITYFGYVPSLSGDYTLTVGGTPVTVSIND